METGHGGDEAQAEPIAESAATAFKPIEAHEHVLTLIDGNSGSIIGDRNNHVAAILLDLHDHSAGVTAVFDCVIDKIGHSVEQEISVAPDERALIRNDFELNALIFRGGVE